MSTLNQIKFLEQKSNQLINEILEIQLIIPGSYKVVYCKCGKDNCWCKNAAGHPFRRITWSENGLSKTKAIPEKDVRWINEVTENYRIYKNKIKELQKIEKKLKILLEKHIKEVIHKTRKLKGYL